MSKVQKAIEVVNTLPNLSDSERKAMLDVLMANEPWYIKILRVLKILGTLAGYFLAGLGLASCTNLIGF